MSEQLRKWSEWRLFPDPRKGETLTAPFGAGCYELRNGAQLVLFGKGDHVAQRMASLLPLPLGTGTRNNREKRKYVSDHLGSIEYRTLACLTPDEAEDAERAMKANRLAYLFHESRA